MRRGAHAPIFDPEISRGQVRPGALVGTLPPCIPSIALEGTVADTRLDAATAVVKSGDIVFTGCPTGLVAVDVSTPSSPSIVGWMRNVPMQTPQQVIVVGAYLYACYSANIAIIDPADTHMVPLTMLPIPFANGPINGVVDGSYLYLARSGALSVIDITSPLAPTIVGTVTDSTNFNNARGIIKDGNYCYVTSTGGNRFVVVDVSNPAAPAVAAFLSGTVNSYGNAQGIARDGNYCYISASGGLTVVDVSTPTAPTFVTHVNPTLSGGSGWLVKDGNNIFVSAGLGLHVYNASTPAAPTFVTTLSTNVFTGMVKNGNYLYGTLSTLDRINVIDVTTPASPSVVGNLVDSNAIDACVGIATIGSALYVAGSQMFSEIDISTPTAPSTTWTKHGNWASFNDVTVIGSYLYGLQGQLGSVAIGGMVTVDISDPTDMLPLAQFAHANLFGGQATVTDGSQLYVASSTQSRLTIIDPTTPTALSHAGSLLDATNLAGATALDVQGGYCYVAAPSTDRLTIVDVSTPSSPTVAGSVQDASQLDFALAVAVDGNYAYVGALVPNRLTIVDVSVPATPAIVGSLQDATNLNRAIGVVYDAGKCYVACQTANRMTVIDVSTPSAPTYRASLQDNTNLNRLTRSFVKDGDFLYVPCNIGDALTVLEVDCVQP